MNTDLYKNLMNTDLYKNLMNTDLYKNLMNTDLYKNLMNTDLYKNLMNTDLYKNLMNNDLYKNLMNTDLYKNVTRLHSNILEQLFIQQRADVGRAKDLSSREVRGDWSEEVLPQSVSGQGFGNDEGHDQQRNHVLRQNLG